MRIKITETKVYKFEELTDEQKDKVIEKHYDINVDYDWYKFTIEDVKDIGKIIGIDIDNVFFSGFSSQGDGACFEGHYSYKKGALKEIKEYAPKDVELHRIAKELQELQKKAFFRLTANVKHRGHYYHENCTIINVSAYDHNDNDLISNDQEDALIELLKDFMRWIYRLLEKEYEYLTSREAIIETIEANDYEFDENGNIA